MKLKNTDLVKPGMLKFAPHEQGDWFVWVANEVPLDMILAPGFWAHHAGTIKPGSRITVMRQDFSLDVELRVIKVEPGLVYVRALRTFVDDADLKALGSAAASGVTGADEAKVPEGYKVGFAPRGEKPGHFVHLNATGSAVARGLASRKEAIAFAREHYKKSNPGADPDAEDVGAVVKAA